MTDANYRILVIDDTESIHADFRKTLLQQAAAHDRLSGRENLIFGGDAPAAAAVTRPPFTLDSAMQGEEGLNKVREAAERGRPYAMAFVDMRMPPGWDGLKTIQQLWRHDPRLQVVICTAYSDQSLDQMVNELGMTDRLLVLKKPFDPAEVAQLATALTEKWNLSRRAEMKLDELERLVCDRTQALHDAAQRDHLTGLPNRAKLTERLAGVVGRHQDTGRRFAVIYLDFDRFKVINDSLGHTVGDQMLIGIARRLQTLLAQWGAQEQADCTPVRVGGDEFVVLVEGHRDHEQVAELARRLVVALAEPHTLCGHTLSTTVSIGITTSEHRYTDPDHICRDADVAMYQAKGRGKNCYVLFDRTMHEQMLMQVRLETDMRHALEENQHTLVYQPIVDLSHGRIIGVESLLRWRHPQLGNIEPDRFIPIAEETGWIRQLGRWTFEQAATLQARWRQTRPQSPIYVAVNVSKRQLLDPDFVAFVRDTLERHGLEPASLMIEVTETCVMDGRESVVRVLEALHELGVRLAMDDFGKGHSSLTCLHRFPLDVLKIDRAFIANLEHNHSYTAVVQAIVVLAQNLGMQVVAEGLETREQLAQVQALDCANGQGYLMSRPVTADAIEALLAAGARLAVGSERAA